MNSNFYSLTTLKSLDDVMVEQLRKLGITNLGDLLAYQPFRYARFVRAAKDRLLRKDEIVQYLDASVREKDPAEILVSPAEALQGLGPQHAGIFKRLGVLTVADLASFAPFNEAEEIVTRTTSDDADPFAPSCVLPACKKFTRNSKGYVSFFKQEEIRDLSVISDNTAGPGQLISGLFHFAGGEPKIIYLGYSVSYLQEWIYCGVHLGEPRGSVNLFMGQDTQVSVLDWRRAQRAFRTEDTQVAEHLSSTLFHQRAVDEVARATAEEHQHGGTSAFGANAATAGSFAAAGAVIGGVGGGISGGLTGLSVDILTGGGTAGLGTLTGAAIGTAVGSFAGAAAGSLIFSGAATLGFVETDAEGDREIFATSAQNIQLRTIQNSSSLRSFWSNIITQSVQEEQQTVRTDRVTNHNRIHALNAIYFEVLNEYRVNITAKDFAPILFLPFKPLHFTEAVLQRYWWLIRTLLGDEGLVRALDQHFLTLNSDPSPAAGLDELPEIGDVETASVEVKVNLDGSAMEDFFEDAVKSVEALAFLGPLGLVAAVAALIVENLMDDAKRRKVKVSIVTGDGEVELDRDGASDGDPNFIGRYTTSTRIPIHAIEKIRITNANPEFTIGTPRSVPSPFGDVQIPHVSFDVNELSFEDITAKLTIRDKSRFRSVLPRLGALESRRTVRPSTLKVGANRSKDIPWDVADKLRAQFGGVEAERGELERELSSEELTAAKISNLLGFLNANRYGFTRLILQSTEREQVINVLEGVKVGGVDLSAIAGTTPLGFCGNHVVLPLRNYTADGSDNGPIRLNTVKLESALALFQEVARRERHEVIEYFKYLLNFLREFFHYAEGEGSHSTRDVELLDRLKALGADVAEFLDLAGELPPDPLRNFGLKDPLDVFRPRVTRAIRRLLAFLNAPVQTNATDAQRLCGYYGSVRASLACRMGHIISSDEVSLPSPAVFMEPVLSNAKGAELYDMRRNSHYEILPAPGIGDADPNVTRAQDVQLTPNAPAATLTIQNAPQFPLPNSINAALAEAGNLDLSTLISTNAGTLNTTLSNLSAVATELARASAQLTGDAQKQALASAGDVARQVGDIIGKSLQTTPAAAPAPRPQPPAGQQSKAEVHREVERINAGGGSDKEKRERKETIGAPVAPDDTRDYQLSIVFLDELGIPYSQGEFTLTMTFFEFPDPVDINGGAAIRMDRGQFRFPDTFTLRKGRRASVRFDADIASVIIPGFKDFNLPDREDILFKCRMMSEKRTISSTDVRSAVKESIESSSFGVALNPIFESFLNAAVEFPFKVFKVSADGGTKTKIDLRAEYSRSDSDTTTDTTGNTTVTEYEVILPFNGWDIEVA